jgi:hypothetical protein
MGAQLRAEAAWEGRGRGAGAADTQERRTGSWTRRGRERDQAFGAQPKIATSHRELLACASIVRPRSQILRHSHSRKPVNRALDHCFFFSTL